MQAVRPQFHQPNWNCRPISDIRRPELVATKQSLARASRERPRVAGTGAASRGTSSSGDITRCVVPSRHGVLSLSPNCPEDLHYTRASDSAGR